VFKGASCPSPALPVSFHVGFQQRSVCSHTITTGTYGNTTSLGNASCEAPSPIGHYCVEASVLPIPCPPGRFGAQTGLKTRSCSAECESGEAEDEGFCRPASCPPGHYCPLGTTNPIPCGGAHLYCPEGSALPTPVASGHYSIGPLSITGSYQSPEDELTRVNQWPCEPGSR
jgi:hypothetical protein